MPVILGKVDTLNDFGILFWTTLIAFVFWIDSDILVKSEVQIILQKHDFKKLIILSLRILQRKATTAAKNNLCRDSRETSSLQYSFALLRAVNTQYISVNRLINSGSVDRYMVARHSVKHSLHIPHSILQMNSLSTLDSNDSLSSPLPFA